MGCLLFLDTCFVLSENRCVFFYVIRSSRVRSTSQINVLSLPFFDKLRRKAVTVGADNGSVLLSSLSRSCQ